jgi:hypothetical protein
MSDENIHDGNKGWAQEPVQEPAAATTADAPKAFCQDCGKPLTPETLQRQYRYRGNRILCWLHF